MRIPRTTLFLLFVLLLAFPLLVNKLLWLVGTKETVGVYSYKTMGNALEQIRSSHTVCFFIKNNDTIWFNGPPTLKLNEGAAIKVRYKVSNPTNANVMSFRGYWGETIVYGGLVFIVILCAFLNKGVFPKGLKIAGFNKKLLVQIT